MANKRLSKKVAKLEKEADDLRKKAEKKASQLQDKASDRIDDLTGEKDKKGKKGLILLVLGLAGGAAVALKKKRDQELDEALWEEPRSV